MRRPVQRDLCARHDQASTFLCAGEYESLNGSSLLFCTLSASTDRKQPKRERDAYYFCTIVISSLRVARRVATERKEQNEHFVAEATPVPSQLLLQRPFGISVPSLM